MTYQRAAFKALYRLISEHHVSEKEALAIAQSIFFPSVMEVPVYPQQEQCQNQPPPSEPDSVHVRGFQP